MKWLTLVVSALLAGGAAAPSAQAFCGFYVAQGDAKIFNHASKVVLARDGNRTVLTMVSDFQGDPKEFAVVVPVPVVPEKGQVHIGDAAWVDHLDAYSAPRLVEYTDPNPCPEAEPHYRGGLALEIAGDAIALKAGVIGTKGSIRVEAQYKVDEYEIVILSATEGRGLDQWLKANGYRIPDGAPAVLQSYIKQGMFFFVAKVDVQEQKRLGYNYLRPIQVAFESPKFVLPIRLGMVNADGPQEMFVFTLTRQGRVEALNYRTVKLPTGIDVPEFVKGEFPDFYRLVFADQHRKAGESGVFLEYAWVVVPGTPSCDPCTAPYLTELRSLGAFWIAAGPGPPGDAVLTRLHLRYDGRHFPEDLQLMMTADRENWQARYVLHHPYRGPEECPQLVEYRKGVWERRRKEAENYCSLTGARFDGIRAKMGVDERWSEPNESLVWWERLWK
ncbi:MAG: DUF2330 domain-containing protein [Candidatus Eisenbacteria bacterium]|uniref:DUF2330 domain-containing protein n=1 Tax=Eiseniibacteriota bacterium TaxID=2212470 RepID=A0A538TNH4_UNCEI|nr:MAG: DUF2330 domain-containing protein [Candidatus Eisenbacteria bacterium]